MGNRREADFIGILHTHAGDDDDDDEEEEEEEEI